MRQGRRCRSGMMTHAPNPLATTPLDHPAAPAASPAGCTVAVAGRSARPDDCANDPGQHQRRREPYLSAAPAFPLERLHHRRRCLPLFPLYGRHFTGALTWGKTTPGRSPPCLGPSSAPTRADFVRNRNCHQWLSALRSPYASGLRGPAEDRHLLLCGQPGLPLAARRAASSG